MISLLELVHVLTLTPNFKDKSVAITTFQHYPIFDIDSLELHQIFSQYGYL